MVGLHSAAVLRFRFSLTAVRPVRRGDGTVVGRTRVQGTHLIVWDTDGRLVWDIEQHQGAPGRRDWCELFVGPSRVRVARFEPPFLYLRNVLQGEEGPTRNLILSEEGDVVGHNGEMLARVSHLVFGSNRPKLEFFVPCSSEFRGLVLAVAYREWRQYADQGPPRG